MERLLVVRCPELMEPDESGSALRVFARVLDAVGAFCPWVTVVAPGIASLPARGPARFFGGEPVVVDHIGLAVSVVAGVSTVEVGIADGLFAADLAAQAGVVVPLGETPGFLAPWPLAVLSRPELTDFLGRLGIDTLGDFGVLPERHVLGRLGADGVVCHRVARGLDGELPGHRRRSTAPAVTQLADSGAPPTIQEDFWAGRREADLRVARALAGAQGLLGAEAVRVVRRRGGRSPDEAFGFVAWSPEPIVTTPPAEPWPGRLPSPAPAVVYAQPRPAELVAADGPVTVTGRGDLSATPERLSIDGDRWRAVEGWAGPWPTWVRWWTPTRRRTADLQVVTEGQMAHLLRTRRGAWWLVATYD